MARTRKSGTLSLGIAGLLASALLTGCSPSGDVIDADYAQVCQDKTNEQRVDDNHCSEQGRSGGHYGWYFFSTTGSSSNVPPVGQRLTGGVTSVPAGKSIKSGIGSKGGTVSRGGFGSSSKGGSSGG